MRGVALSIAGSDPSGGAGVQADLKTFAAFDVYGAAVVTALTAQNTCGVRATMLVPPAFLLQELDAVLDDLVLDAVKTGMLPNGEAVATVADALARIPSVPFVLDPVLVATSGDALADPTTLEALRARLLPRCTLVTPNLREAEALTGRPVRTRDDMAAAALALLDLGAAAALVKGGHLPGSAYDVLAIDGRIVPLDAPRVGRGSLHGTGCTLSAAVTALLARGVALADAAARAKRYVSRAIGRAPCVGRGRRPLDHGAPTDGEGGGGDRHG
jgi:hydroxymethylpyrimidine/phosphomethylpyrimidine kinase